MPKPLEILPGITLRCFHDTRFKQGALSIQLLRPTQTEEASVNALIPAVLLRGCEDYPDLQCITQRLDDLYGASVGTLVRRIGDYQAIGFYCGFIEDRFALPGDTVLRPMLQFVGQLLLRPLTQDGGFCKEYISSEKKNLISTIEAKRSDKRAYAAAQLQKRMCRGDSFGVPILGTREQVQAIDARSAYCHYQRLLRECPIDVYYVGASQPEQVAALLRPIFLSIPREPVALPRQTPFQGGAGSQESEAMDITQGKLGLGFVTPITNQDSRFAAMQLCNSIFGGGMTNKIFNRIREELSLCYEIGSGYTGSKGILTVHAGIDCHQEEAVRREIFAQLEAIQAGSITENELAAAKEYLLSSLRAVYDSPGAIENFFATAARSGLGRSPEVYAQELQAVTVQQVAEAAQTLAFHSSFFLRGTQA